MVFLLGLWLLVVVITLISIEIKIKKSNEQNNEIIELLKQLNQNKTE